jgi:hypothetical protein
MNEREARREKRRNEMRNMVAILLLSGIALTASAKNSYIPVAGTVPGVNGTYFRTDLRIFNPSDTVDISVSIHFLPTGMDGSNIPGRLVTVKKREMVVLNDVVGTFLEWQTPAIGALWLDSDTDASYSYIADSRIYTNSPNPAVSGTYGQYVPAMTAAEAKEKTVVLHLKNDFFGEYRTNVGVMNPGTEPATVTARLYGFDPTPLGTLGQLTIPPKSMQQVSIQDLFGFAVFPDGFVTFESNEPVFTWGSVIDNRTGDAVFVRGIEDKAEVISIF